MHLNSKYALLNLRVKYGSVVLLTILLFLLILFSSIYYQTYDSYKSTGTFKDNKISITIPSSDTAKITSSNFLKIRNKKYQFSILSVSESEYLFELNETYQTIEIQIDKYFYDNEILSITFYRNRQRIIEKLFYLLK